MESALSRIKYVMESSFQGENINGYDMNLNFDFTIAESGEDVSPSDHLIILAEPKSWNKKIPGASDWDPNSRVAGYVAIVDADYFTGLYDRYIGQEGPRTSAHEMGHLLGLGHRNHDTSNLMAQGQSYKRGNDINSTQLLTIQKSLISPTFLSARLNHGNNRQYGMALYPFRFVKELFKDED